MALSTVRRGTLFEQRSLKLLQDHLSMSLRRVGGKSDGGVDLIGWWWLPQTDHQKNERSLSNRRRLRVLAQCKAEKKKPGPNYVRELEGVLYRYMALSNQSSSTIPLVALLVSESPFTKAALLRAHSSPVPFFLLHLPPMPDAVAASEEPSEEIASSIGTAVWNPALAGARGLLGGKMEARWERSLSGAGRPGLWCGGERLPSWTPNKVSPEEEHEDRLFETLADEAR